MSIIDKIFGTTPKPAGAEAVDTRPSDQRTAAWAALERDELAYRDDRLKEQAVDALEKPAVSAHAAATSKFAGVGKDPTLPSAEFLAEREAARLELDAAAKALEQVRATRAQQVREAGDMAARGAELSLRRKNLRVADYRAELRLGVKRQVKALYDAYLCELRNYTLLKGAYGEFQKDEDGIPEGAGLPLAVYPVGYFIPTAPFVDYVAKSVFHDGYLVDVEIGFPGLLDEVLPVDLVAKTRQKIEEARTRGTLSLAGLPAWEIAVIHTGAVPAMVGPKVAHRRRRELRKI